MMNNSRSKYKRKFHTGSLGAGEKSLLDFILPSDAQGKPVIIMEHSLSTESIAYIGLAIMSSMIISGIVVNKFSK